MKSLKQYLKESETYGIWDSEAVDRTEMGESCELTEGLVYKSTKNLKVGDVFSEDPKSTTWFKVDNITGDKITASNTNDKNDILNISKYDDYKIIIKEDSTWHKLPYQVYLKNHMNDPIAGFDTEKEAQDFIKRYSKAMNTNYEGNPNNYVVKMVESIIKESIRLSNSDRLYNWMLEYMRKHQKEVYTSLQFITDSGNNIIISWNMKLNNGISIDGKKLTLTEFCYRYMNKIGVQDVLEVDMNTGRFKPIKESVVKEATMSDIPHEIDDQIHKLKDMRFDLEETQKNWELAGLDTTPLSNVITGINELIHSMYNNGAKLADQEVINESFRKEPEFDMSSNDAFMKSGEERKKWENELEEKMKRMGNEMGHWGLRASYDVANKISSNRNKIYDEFEKIYNDFDKFMSKYGIKKM